MVAIIYYIIGDIVNTYKSKRIRSKKKASNRDKGTKVKAKTNRVNSRKSFDFKNIAKIELISVESTRSKSFRSFKVDIGYKKSEKITKTFFSRKNLNKFARTLRENTGLPLNYTFIYKREPSYSFENLDYNFTYSPVEYRRGCFFFGASIMLFFLFKAVHIALYVFVFLFFWSLNGYIRSKKTKS
jgi:hypothetical protein